ncbi:Uncharacterized ABC transporter ATP-binding protein TM_0352 [Geodia barretti]|uniref:Uncharacterized ABC transporter ATP-binding protein TM_0352 n=1 Tax=Geodia barretti TaxID=519541 RepID=A0AA35RU40_GEOBA|nr:Uncharacterized ABC transporter ATP-binding protein TM_0352 [Geodia barretti]
MPDRELVRYRRLEVGFVWQATGRNLVPYLTAQDNIELPLALAGADIASRHRRSLELLAALDMTEKGDRYPQQLSGGEQQRVAIGVALANSPPLLLADEPTGELDTDNANRIFDLMRRINQLFGVTVVMVTHYPGVAEHVDRVIHIRDGRISSESFLEPTFQKDGENVLREYLVVDEAGRLQLPQDYMSQLQLQGLAKADIAERTVTSSHQLRLPHAASRTVRRRTSITRAFGSGDQRVVALQEVDLNVFPGEFLAVTGRSGSGKTTLLNLLAGLDQPTAGHVLFDGQDLSAIPDASLVELRRHKIGFVFQSFGLMPLLSAYENVELPLHIGGVSWRERRRRALEALELVGLGLRSRHRPYELSGGEQQRVAIARALVSNPQVVFADEPTGETGQQHSVDHLRDIA